MSLIVGCNDACVCNMHALRLFFFFCRKYTGYKLGFWIFSRIRFFEIFFLVGL